MATNLQGTNISLNSSCQLATKRSLAIALICTHYSITNPSQAIPYKNYKLYPLKKLWLISWGYLSKSPWFSKFIWVCKGCKYSGKMKNEDKNTKMIEHHESVYMVKSANTIYLPIVSTNLSRENLSRTHPALQEIYLVGMLSMHTHWPIFSHAWQSEQIIGPNSPIQSWQTNEIEIMNHLIQPKDP